jgi:hypothetical protein
VRAKGAAALGAVLALAALRFREFLAGGLFEFRDAGYFFRPLRHVIALALRAGEFPAWNDWASSGRALAADPNGAVFWPLTPLLVVVTPDALVLLHVALCLTLFFAALRWAGVGVLASAAGTAVLLFSGVFQTLPVFFTTLASAAPLPLAVVALGGDWPGERRAGARRAAVGGLALGLSFLGGEPMIAATGAAAAAILVAVRSLRSPRRLPWAGAAFVLAAGLAAVQLLPAFGELARSARSASLRPEDGALFWSVRPSRLLTLLEPRLTGDPFAERADLFWGAGTFDAGNPYFYDVAVGLVPLLLAAAASATRKGRGALLLAGAGAFLSFGRFLPGYASTLGRLSFVRYPEKWWVVVTFALAAAAAAGVDALLGADRTERDRTADRLAWAGAVAAGLLVPAAALAAIRPGALRRLLWSLGLGEGPTPETTVAASLTPLLAVAAGSALLIALLAGRVRSGRMRGTALAMVAAGLFLLDAPRRVAGQCPAGDPVALLAGDPALEAVRARMPMGRFYDDGADDLRTALRRAAERGAADPLRPTRGVFFGIRYAGENDVDRMTPSASVEWARALARLPWGGEKAAILAGANVSVLRTAAPAPDPPGARELLRSGGDRIVAIDPVRPEFFAGGRTVEVLERRPGRSLLRVAAGVGARLQVARTFDPSWKVTVAGVGATLVPDGPFGAVDLPASEVLVDLRYDNPRIRTGVAISVLSLAIVAGLEFVRGRRS